MLSQPTLPRSDECPTPHQIKHISDCRHCCRPRGVLPSVQDGPATASFSFRRLPSPFSSTRPARGAQQTSFSPRPSFVLRSQPSFAPCRSHGRHPTPFHGHLSARMYRTLSRDTPSLDTAASSQLRLPAWTSTWPRLVQIIAPRPDSLSCRRGKSSSLVAICSNFDSAGAPFANSSLSRIEHVTFPLAICFAEFGIFPQSGKLCAKVILSLDYLPRHIHVAFIAVCFVCMGVFWCSAKYQVTCSCVHACAFCFFQRQTSSHVRRIEMIPCRRG